MKAVKIDWENAADTTAEYDYAEIDHDDHPQTMCPWIEQLRNCPDGRWIYSIDVPDMSVLDRNGYPFRPRSIAFGIAYSRAEAVLAVEEAIRRLVSGVAVVS